MITFTTHKHRFQWQRYGFTGPENKYPIRTLYVQQTCRAKVDNLVRVPQPATFRSRIWTYSRVYCIWTLVTILSALWRNVQMQIREWALPTLNTPIYYSNVVHVGLTSLLYSTCMIHVPFALLYNTVLYHLYVLSRLTRYSNPLVREACPIAKHYSTSTYCSDRL